MNSAPIKRQILISTLTLGGIHICAPWPGPQSVLHVLLVLGLAPDFRSPLTGMLWAAAAGWVLEGSLRLYPHLGGTALANMTMLLIVRWTLMQWPPRARYLYWGRMAILAVFHYLLIYVLVRLAAGSHLWGWGVLWTLFSVPLWATLAFRLHRPFRS